MEYFKARDTEGLCVLVDLADDIENFARMMLDEIEDNAPLSRYKEFSNYETFVHCWSSRANYIHAMTAAMYTMVSELHTSLSELDKICNLSEVKQ